MNLRKSSIIHLNTLEGVLVWDIPTHASDNNPFFSFPDAARGSCLVHATNGQLYNYNTLW
jgi:hypothetical protein